MVSKSRRIARRASLGLIALFCASLLVAALASGASAAGLLTMTTPKAGVHTNATPTFSGETLDTVDNVKVFVYKGEGTEGSIADTLEAAPEGGSWSVEATPGLLAGTYTAQAEQVEELGGELGGETAKSVPPVTFHLVTGPPQVTIAGPKSPTGDTTPSFSGTASENTEVVVHVFEGASEVATAKTTASGGSWSTTGAALSKELSSGKHSFTAKATEKSGVGYLDGESAEEVGFEVDTLAPVVTIEAPLSPSSNRRPAFKGEASENTQVEVHVFEGATEVASAVTTAAGGHWSTTGAALSKELLSGDRSFTARATEKSGISGNAEGKAGPVSFEVDTEPPVVTIEAPLSPSSNRRPAFKGEASENTEVVVHVFEGATEVASAVTTAAGGHWSTTGAALSKELLSGDRSFTARATEKSGISGNAEGKAGPVSFEVDTEPPVVTIEAPLSPSSNRRPAFKGEASENTEVVVHVFEGATEVASAVTTAAGGHWSTTGAALSKELLSGKRSFTAKATEKSGISGNPDGEAGPVGFEVDTLAPVVALLEGPPPVSNDRTPSFSGTASEDGELVVHVMEGSTEVGSATTTASEGSWAATVSKPLAAGKHSYTAFATEKSPFPGNPEGKSNKVGFEVDTLAPVVTIEAPASPSSNRRPAFKGEASENTEVVVHVFEGATEVASAVTTAAGGHWSTTGAVLSKELLSGKRSFTARATEKSGISGNPDGEAGPVGFEVDTLAPVVTIEAPASPSSNRRPAFKGEASENTEVVVHVFEGATEVASAVTTAAGGHWSTTGAVLSKELLSGKRSFTARATEKSGISGNPDGEAGPVGFEVDTLAPVVTIEAPASPSSNRRPAFKGEASENTEVVVHVFEGATEVASAVTTAAGGHWSTTGAVLSKELLSGKRSFTARATEKSGISGNPDGEAGPVGFEVDTLAPVVTIEAPASPSSNRRPAFKGEASENTEVVVHVFEGATEVASAVTTAAGGHWSTTGAVLSKELLSGKRSFTARATEKSGISGNPDGEAGPVGFEVDTLAPVVTIEAPASPSSNRRPAFKGEASENTEVVVHVFEGATEVASAVTTAAGGHWSTTGAVLSKELLSGKRSFTAKATEKSGISGNPDGEAGPVGFEVDTLAPVVTIEAPASPSSNRRPAFKGEASENTQVEVHVFEGATEVASAVTTAAGGHWSTTGAALSKELLSGKRSFTAKATEKSGISGNPDGEAGPVGFEVNTLAPEVKITTAPPERSNNVNPSFAGTASEETEVVVHVFLGTEEVASASTTASGGHWSTSGLSKVLAPGKHTFTAKATEKSGINGNEDGTSEQVTFKVDTEAPTVVLTEVPVRSNNRSPSFGGTASEAGEVVVHVMKEGKQVATGTGKVKEGKWKATVSSPLEEGRNTFKVFATEKSGIENGEGKSGEGEFVVDTLPPEVKLTEVPPRSHNRSPSFGGTASEAGEVVVHVTKEGKQVATGTATVKEGRWKATVSSPLEEGRNTFKVFATEKSGIENGEGKSGEGEFVVDTLPPEVKLTEVPPRSHNRSPSFGGTASEAGEVVVHVTKEGKQVATGTATVKEGKWKATVSSPLEEGRNTFKVFATEKSGIENGEGKSGEGEFVVDTLPPEVKLTEVPPRSHNRSPSFGGTASEAGEVVVHVTKEGKQVATGTATVKEGKWKATVSSPLEEGRNTFKVFATENSGIENGEGKSGEGEFVVDTLPPTVTMEPLALISNNTTPAFSGTASETLLVTVEVYKGEKVEGTPFTTISAGVTGEHKWATAHLTKELENGKYTVVATEPSSIENAAGHSEPDTFEVNTKAPEVKITPPASPSKNTKPSFSGTVNGPTGGTATVQIYEGVSTQGQIKETVSGPIVKGTGTWSTGELEKALPSGRHKFTAVALATSSIGNETGKSAPVTFEVVTVAPEVTLAPPPPISNNPTPSFHGTATEKTEVVVSIYRGSVASGSPVATAKASGTGGAWSSPPLAVPLEDGQYTAVATQESAIGNGPGKSAPATFEIDTTPPTVRLNGLPTPSSDRVPAFSGTANDHTKVVVKLYSGSKAQGTPAVSVSAEVFEGEWFAGALEEKLEWGEYTAVATEESSIGNKQGESAPFTFVVAKIPPGVLTEGSAAVSRTSATLYGAVNPLGAPVTACNLEVGPSTSYGRTIGCALVSEATWFPPTAVGFVPVFIRIYGLTPGTVYHYRVVAASEGGTGDAADATFTTLPPLSTPEPPKPPPGNSGVNAVASFFAAQLKPTGKGAKIGALLKAGLYRQRFKAPGAGTASIKWYYLPPGAKLSKAKKKPQPVLVASGSVTFKSAGSATLTLRLTSAGRRLLGHSKSLRLTASCTFKPATGTAVTTTGTFQLKR